MANANSGGKPSKMTPETPKAVSSRLLTMKFMQRAVASASSSPASPDMDSPSSKRRKMQHTPAQSKIHAAIDEAAIKAALEDQEAKRQAALAQHSAGDTHWVLNPRLNTSDASKTSASPLKIVYVGYGDIDSGNETGDNEDEPQIGRTSNRKTKDTDKKKSQQSTEKDGSDSDLGCSDNSSDDSDASDAEETNKTSQTSPSRSQSQLRSNTESKRAKEFRDKRRKKEIRMNQITSISSGGGSSNNNNSPMNCYKCKQAGHKAINCPKGSSRPLQRG